MTKPYIDLSIFLNYFSSIVSFHHIYSCTEVESKCRHHYKCYLFSTSLSI